jgi:benzoyl-CoA 2,3-epoxidase subunit B
VPALTAINMRLRDDYTRDAAGGVGRWNKIIEKHNIQFEMKLPHEAFHRQIGVFAGKHFDPEGKLLSKEPNTRPRPTTGCRPRPTAISSSR